MYDPWIRLRMMPQAIVVQRNLPWQCLWITERDLTFFLTEHIYDRSLLLEFLGLCLPLPMYKLQDVNNEKRVHSTDCIRCGGSVMSPASLPNTTD